MKYRNLGSFVIGLFAVFFQCYQPAASIYVNEMEDNKQLFTPDCNWTVRISSIASITEQFAAQEFVGYVERQSGVRLKIRHDDGSPGRCFLIGRTNLAKKERFFDESPRVADDSFIVAPRNGSVILLGATDRGTLYAVYCLLEHFGWRWPMPSFHFSRNLFRTKPISNAIYLPTKDIRQTPVFVYRGGLIVTSSWKQGPESKNNLLALIDWISKMRFNVVGIHIKHFESVPNEIIEEIEKRNLRLDVEGHSWSYLREGEAGWTDYRTDMGILADKAVDFVRRHPEIDYFGPWGDDNTNWEFCETGNESAVIRSSDFYNLLKLRIDNFEKKVRLIIPAYQQLLFPPVTHPYPKESLIYLCPVDRDFGIPIYEKESSRNAVYLRALEKWKNQGSERDMIFYSYYRKHAWNSFPVNTPWLMSKEIEWLATQRVQGVWNYIVSDDWLSYDLQHYTYARLCWNPSLSIEALVEDYCRSVGDNQIVLSLKKFHKNFEKIVLALDSGGFFGYTLKGMRRLPANKLRDLSIQLNKIDADMAAIDYNGAREIVSIRRLWCRHVLKKINAALSLKEGANKYTVDEYLKFLRDPGRLGLIGKITINKLENM